MSKPRPEQKEKRDEWIEKAQDLIDRQQNTAQQIQELQQAVTDAQAKADDVNALPDDPADPDAKTRANKELAETQRRLTDALHQQSREETQSRIDAEKPPPYEKDGKGSGTNDQDAADLGKGLVKGVFQEFGIDGSVFKGMKAPNDWGLTKILGGVLSFGLNLSAAKHDASGGGSSDTDGGVLGMIEDAIPALKNLLHPGTTDGQPSAAAPAPDAAALPAPPAPASAPQEPLPAPASAPSVPAVPAPAAPAPAPPAPPAPARAPIDVKGYQFGSPDRPAPPSPAPNQVVTPGVGGAPPLPGFPTPPPGATPAQIQGAKPPPSPGPAPALTPPTGVTIPGSPKAGQPVAPALGVPAQPAGYKAHHAVPGTLEVGKNWLPGGLNPGLKLPTAAQRIDGADAAFAGIVTSAARVATTLASPQGILQPDMSPPDLSKYSNGGAPDAPADVTPQIGTTPAPTAAPAPNTGSGTTISNPLTVNNTYQGFNPTPQVADQVRNISLQTSAPAMSGGAGIPL
ncbi:hypothetical protein JCM12141A_46990 [Mycolicibacterium hodleri]